MAAEDDPQVFSTFDIADIVDFQDPVTLRVESEFNLLTVENCRLIDEFDPNGPIASKDISTVNSLWDTRPRDPQLQATFQASMLHRIGLDSALQREYGARVLFDLQYSKGEVLQLKHFIRADGVAIPLLTVMTDRGHGPTALELKIFSYAAGEEKLQNLQLERDEWLTTQQFTSAFGMTSEQIQAAGYTIGDIKGFLRNRLEFEKLPTLRPDLSALDVHRTKLAKAMLPATGFLRKRRDPKVAEYTQQYVDALIQVTENFAEHESEPATTITHDERELRLQELNVQLQARKRATLLGALSIAGPLTAGSSAAGAGLGVVFDVLGYGTAPVSFLSLFGTLAGAVLGLKVVNEAQEVYDWAQGFESIAYQEGATIEEELSHERQIATKYLPTPKIRSPKRGGHVPRHAK